MSVPLCFLFSLSKTSFSALTFPLKGTARFKVIDQNVCFNVFFDITKYNLWASFTSRQLDVYFFNEINLVENIKFQTKTYKTILKHRTYRTQTLYSTLHRRNFVCITEGWKLNISHFWYWIPCHTTGGARRYGNSGSY